MTRIPGVIHYGHFPVPYVAAWSSEATMRIATDPLIKAPAIFRSGRRGEGKPLFGKMDESRVRRVVVKRMCQVCTKSIGPAGYAVDVPLGRSGNAPIINEPLTCQRCFRISLELCPGIATLRGDRHVLIALVRRYDVVASTLQPADAEGANDQLNTLLRAWTGAPVVGYCRSALTDYDIIDPATLRRVA